MTDEPSEVKVERKRYRNTIKVSNDFADMVIELAESEGISTHKFMDKHFMQSLKFFYRTLIKGHDL